MLFNAKTVALIMMIAVAGTVSVFLYGSQADASPPNKILNVDQRGVYVGQVLDRGTISDNNCVMPHSEIEVEVEVSIVEPKAGLTLEIDDECRLIVSNTYRNTIDISPLGVRGKSSSNRYKSMAKSEWSDLFQLDVAANYVRYTYDETSSGFSFVGSPSYQCVKAAWWKTINCGIDSKSATSSSIKATAYGNFALKNNAYRHTQKPTFTARANGRGTATCWSSTNLSHLRFHCDGSLTRN